MGVSVGRKNKDSDIWYLFIRDKSLPNGRMTRRVPGHGDEAEALAYELKEKLDAKIVLKEPLFPEPKEPRTETLSEYFEKFKKASSVKSLAPSTQRSYTDAFERYIEPEFGHVAMNMIRRDQVKGFIGKLKDLRYTRGKKKPKKHPLSKDSVRIIISTLRRILNEAIDDGILQVNAAVRQGKNFKELSKVNDVSPLEYDDCIKFLKKANENSSLHFPLFATLLHAGLRISEAIGLMWSDVNLEKRLITVRRQGKDRRTTKTGRIRKIEMSAFLVSVLRMHQLRVTRSLDGVKPDFVFVTPIGTPLDADNIRSQEFLPIVKAAGLPHFRLHDLRHSYATVMIDAGVPVAWVSKQLGHKNISMTCDVYYHWVESPEFEKEQNAEPPRKPYTNVLPTIDLAASGERILQIKGL